MQVMIIEEMNEHGEVLRHEHRIVLHEWFNRWTMRFETVDDEVPYPNRHASLKTAGSLLEIA